MISEMRKGAPPGRGAATGGAGLGYRPGLDGLRAVAITMVVGVHAFRWPANGGLGVDLFFVLSGFLITTLLLDERQRNGRVDFIAFYGRRARRLLPGLLAMLAVFAIVAAFRGRLGADAGSVVVGCLYLTNFVVAQSGVAAIAPGVAHLWSLAAEEQFYLIWPTLLFLVLRGHRLAGLAVAGIAIVFTTAEGFVIVGPPDRVWYAPDTRGVGILVGCTAALTLSLWRETAQRVAQVAWPAALLGVSWLALTDLGLRTFHGWLPVFCACCAILIIRAIEPGASLARWLSAGPLPWVGRISYSLYLWHVPIFIWLGAGWVDGLDGRDVAATALSVMAATASFYLVERPFRRRRASSFRQSPVIQSSVTAA